MRLLRLYIQDFACYDHAYINFSEFSSALIVGKKENDDNVSNGVGKTTIFKAIEYVLFNHTDVNLESIIRDETDKCSITLDFLIDDQEYRLSRTRTKKGTSDLSLYKKSTLEGDETEYLHNIQNIPIIDKQDKFWINISGRRTSDTEKELTKLIKINLKSFRIFVHFLQHDFSGLTTATPEKRKLILKEALNLAIYLKLEKLAKEKSTALNKEIEKYQTLIPNLGNPSQDIINLTNQLSLTEQELLIRNNKLMELNQLLDGYKNKIDELNIEKSNLESIFANLLKSEASLTAEKNKLENSIQDYTTKKTNIFKSAENLVKEIDDLTKQQEIFSQLDFSQIDSFSNQIMSNKEKIAQLNLTIQNNLTRIDKLKKPIPTNGECEECRQIISPEHRAHCQTKLDQERSEKQNNIVSNKKEIANLNSINTSMQQEVNKLNISKNQLLDISNKISAKKQENIDKKTLYTEYVDLLKQLKQELVQKDQEFQIVKQQLEQSPIEQSNILQKKINIEKANISFIGIQIATNNKENTHYNNTKILIQHDLKQKNKDQEKMEEYSKFLHNLEEQVSVYPSIIQAFSSEGIPNLIIQNVLDDLQIEANNLLSQIKPGLQISFAVEKETKKEITDTLDINYTFNGKKRYYESISGAMQLAVNFSLKLGLSFVLQKISGIDIKFLLLDEIDQSLDKASVDFFADIVKFFQKDYTILIITHNDRLKDKFSNAILVQQDSNMISRAKVVSSW